MKTPLLLALVAVVSALAGAGITLAGIRTMTIGTTTIPVKLPIRKDTPKARTGTTDFQEAAIRRQQQLNENHGTRIAVGPVGDKPEWQAAIPRAFSQQQPIPQVRLDYFQWLKDPNRAMPCRINGWYGQVLEVKEADRCCLVKIRVSPHLVSEEAVCVTTSDHYLETYRFDGVSLTFVEGAVPADRQQALMTD